MFFLLPLALADVPPIPRSGEAFVTHTVKVEGVSAFPEHVLLLYSTGGEISQYLTFTDSTPAQIDRALHASEFWLLGRSDYDAWSQQSSEEVRVQRAACEERGEGCVHPSRFSPRITPPTRPIGCGVTLSLPTSASIGEPTSALHAFRLETASDASCVITALDTASGALPAPSAPERMGCATATGAPLGAVVLSMMLGLRRRCGS